MKIWITSDNHFNHENIIKYCERPFHSVEEMNDAMIRKWNEKIREDDLVIHLGDFGFGSIGKIEDIRKRPNGTMILLAGNHDIKIINNKNFIVIEGVIKVGNLILSHRPIPQNEIPKGFVNVRNAH